MLGHAASNEMIDAVAPMRIHYDQINCKLLSRPHYVDISSS